MRLAVVVGGWHWPLHFFSTISRWVTGADLFVIAHRDPDLEIVREEKRGLTTSTGPLADLDRELYRDFATKDALARLGWKYSEAPNIAGDWVFFNQWLDGHDYRAYDMILNCHDDTYLRDGGCGFALLQYAYQYPWLILANGTYPEAGEGYVRGSFEFWKREMLDLIGGRIDVGAMGLTRVGKTDTPVGMDALASWNEMNTPLRNFMVERGIANRVSAISPYYRISPWVIEGERGVLNSMNGVPWSFQEGLRRFPV